MSMYRRILMAAWVLMVGGVTVLGLFPKFGPVIPEVVVRTFIILTMLGTVLYIIIRVYRQGMKRAKGK